MKENKKIKILQSYLFMLAACVSYALSTVLFLAPNGIIAGGATGLAVLINYLNNRIPIGMVTIAINVPILILGLKYQGKKFVFKALLTVACLGVITDALSLFLPMLTDNPVLASLYGGICQGVGIGLFIRYEFSSGGTELMGRVTARWIKPLNIPVAVGLLDGIIVILGAILTKSPDNMLYALIVIFVSTKVSEVIFIGVDKSKLCMIVSDKGGEIANLLLQNSPRGITMWDGQGMYTSQTHNVLLTCVKNRQLTQLKAIVKRVDKDAFIMISDSSEIRGKGFQSLE